MNATQHHPSRIVFAVVTAVSLSISWASRANADTLLSGFEGDLSSSIGEPWAFYDTDGATAGDQIWSHQFSSTGVTEGAQALQIKHFTGWTHGFALRPSSEATRLELIDLFATHDTLEFDLTTAPGISWRQIFVIVNSSTTGWSQVQIDIPANATTHFVLPLTNPDPADPLKNWKQSAIDGGATATYWEIVVALQGADLAATADFEFDGDVDGADFLTWQRNVGNMEAGPEQGDTNFDAIVDGLDLATWQNEFGRTSTTVSTTIDNIKFVGGAVATGAVAAIPEPSALTSGLIGAVLTATAAVRGRRRQE